MTEFDPEEFEDKYTNYFPELQRAYKNVFKAMGDRSDSSLTHGVDQQILDESEPFYDDGDFSMQLPDDPAEQLATAEVDDDEFDAVLDRCVDEIESKLRRVFGVGT